MFESTRNFLRRNRRNIAVGFGLVGAGYLAVQYLGNKLSEARSRLSNERVAKENINARFRKNQDDCTFTVEQLLEDVTKDINREIPVEALTYELQHRKASAAAAGRNAKSSSGASVSTVDVDGGGGGGVKEDDMQSLRSFTSDTFSVVAPSRDAASEGGRPRKSKQQLWDEVKITSITRAFTLLYTATLITLLTRVQLNLLGRKEYLSSVLTLAERSRDSSDPRIALEKQHFDSSADDANLLTKQYLAFSWWLLNRGWRDLKLRVEAATKQVFGPLTPRDTITLGRFRQLAMEVRRLVETPGNEEIAWLPFLLPPRDEEPNVLALSGVDQLSPSPELRRLLDETSDILESPTAATVLAHMLAVGFELLIDGKLAQRAFMPKTAAPPPPPPSPEDQSGFGSANEVEDTAATKLANVLAALKNVASVIGAGKDNEFLDVMDKGTELEGFSALVYTSNFESAGLAAAAAAAAELSS